MKIGQSPAINSNAVPGVENDGTVPELTRIIDAKAVQSLMNDFYRLAHIPMALLDLKGNVLVSVGWQDICTKFHRVNTETCKHCIESDINLSKGVVPGRYKLYRCKNNMWDVVTPIVVEGQHIGNVFSGQFFFEEEPLDYELFRSQAKKYGFNDEEYIKALDKVPRLSREAVDTSMAFFMTFANMVSQLSYSNIRLSQSLAERDAVVEALRESEERLRLLSDNLPDSAVYQYVLEPDGSTRFVYFSAGIERLNGVKISDLLRDPGTLHRQIPPEYLERLVEAGARSARELSDFDMELPMRLPDGQLKWMRLHSRPRRLPDGRTIWDGVQTDVTELKRAEKVLHENELRIKVTEAVEAERRRFFDVLEALPVMIALLTPDHQIVFANRCFREMFGESGERHCFKYCFGHSSPCDFCEAYKVFESGKPHRWEVTTPDGSAIEVYDFPFTDVDGSPLILEMNVNITERKAAEERLRDSEEKYRNIVETANEIILITDNKDVIAYVNPKIMDMLGYTPKEVVGRPIWGFISEECKPVVRQNLEKRTQGISGSYELKLIRKDGYPIWTYLNAKPLFDKEGKYAGAMSMLTDITERKKAEEALLQMEEIRKKEIHHRIKNNLQVISSLLDLQAEKFNNRQDIKDSEVLEAFRESQDRVISMALIHEELYKGEEFETLNFSPYIQELAENLFETYSLGDTRITLSMDLEENLFFDMDTAVPLGMIVNELVSNSLKHAFTGRDKGEIRIELFGEESTGLKRENRENTDFTLKISDNGIGMPELDIENLDSLGMQLVTSLVDQLDGELELKRNNGTEFTIKFTVIDKDKQASASATKQPSDDLLNRK
ncbi:PocR ligand-binding domain-containing protein [Methanosarcina sp.]|uniref:PocR ligand-binding domain-containing protein n=1 Tax=Methanosarcina sp. TaxID=2213 RepID=UPI002BE0F97A|nr:PocR ligand-binding domain-containing protein [Methanosarcina sp.]HOW15024.1 PocR ligand-binding domain-containing protein [Methanosarcina sp.]